MTPQELKDELAKLFLTDKSDGTVECVTGSGGRSYRPHTILANADDPSGEVRDDVRSIVEHLAGDGIGESGRYVLMQWLSPAEAGIFAGLCESEEQVEDFCLIDGNPTDSQDFFEHTFKINGYFRPVTAEVKQDLNDCSQLVLMLIPENA